MHGLNEIKAINDWAASRACKKLVEKNAPRADVVHMQGKPVKLNAKKGK